jgi:hypothetical protein
VVEGVRVGGDVGEVLRGQHKVPAVISQHTQDLQSQQQAGAAIRQQVVSLIAESKRRQHIRQHAQDRQTHNHRQHK